MTAVFYATHLVLMILAFAVFAVGFVTAFFFLLEENELKRHRLTSLVRNLPPLETMSGIHYKALTAGFILFSLGMLVGTVLSKGRHGYFFAGDPREIGAVVMWALYALFLNLRTKVGWRGRKGILLSLLGFVGVLLTFLALKHRG